MRVYKIRGFEIIPGYEKLVTLPQRATLKSAGYDIAAAIKKPITIKPGEMAAIDTGLCAYMLDDEEMQLRPRSGLGLKNQVTLQNSPATIDSDYYPNQFKILVRNEGSEDFRVDPGMRIAQAVFGKFLLADDDFPLSGERTGGFGHTGV